MDNIERLDSDYSIVWCLCWYTPERSWPQLFHTKRAACAAVVNSISTSEKKRLVGDFLESDTTIHRGVGLFNITRHEHIFIIAPIGVVGEKQ